MAQKKIKGAFGIVSAVASATSAVSTLKNARSDKDKLALANALGSILVAVTGVLIAIRALKDGK